ncbi:sugar phosphate isomerase/epimerase family protein [Pseudovibrio hongkongensis]|uniref:sugar phosphate isomerase/epimerase family protein n=1 Tax=Polycladidibacter hongkongensis TaxID=1647556 RepID=UPI0008366D84
MDLSMQLYSARNFMPWDEVIAQISKMGYTQVEGFFGVFEQPDAFRKLMDDNNITMPTAHIGPQMLEERLDEVLSLAKILGVKTIYAPYLAPEERPTDRAGWGDFARRLEAIGTQLAKRGFGFGWHNHDFEFFALPDGSIPMDVLMQTAKNLAWEMDVGWTVRAGEDPLAWAEKYGPRISALHVKDIASSGENTEEDGWADVGHGVVGWLDLLPELKRLTNAKVFVMEHDNPSDFARFAGRSIETLAGA